MASRIRKGWLKVIVSKMNIKSKILFIMGLAGMVFLTSLSAQAEENVNYQTLYSETKDVNLYNKGNSIYIKDRDTDKLLFMATPCYETVYTTERLNLREVPSIGNGVVCTLPDNSKLLKVGNTKIGWDIIQIDGVNYFMWDEYLSEKPDESFEVVDVATIDPYVSKPDTGSQSEASQSYNASGTTYLGVYRLTAYCNCSACCGQWAGGATASGTYPIAGRTVAADLPFGTQLLINGNVYTVEDRGVSGNHIDIYFNSHSEALAFGTQYAEVYIP